LTRLYELDSDSPGGYFDLVAIAHELKEDNLSRVWEASRVMESRGWINAMRALGGDCHAMLTGEGRLLVESDGKTGIIPKYKSDPKQYIIIKDSPNAQVVLAGTSARVEQTQSLDSKRKPLFKLIEEIRNTIKNDKNIDETSRKDISLDLETLEIQFKKQVPDKNIIASILEPLSQITSIASFIGQLISYLNP
jgi:hypothetical protein